MRNAKGETDSNILEVKDIDVFYKDSQAVGRACIEVKEQSVTGIIGANGVGKSTMLKAIANLQPIRGGEIWFTGKRIDGMRSEHIVKLGISFIMEGRRLFPKMNVLENLLMGAYLRKGRREIKHSLQELFQLFPILKERQTQHAGTLSGGEQQMLAVGRALMSRPRLIMADELSLGLAPIVIQELYRTLMNINKTGISILLVEQQVPMVMKVCDQVFVMEHGRVILQGKPSELLLDEHVVAAYMGR